MNRTMTRLLSSWLLVGALLIMLTACSPSDNPPGNASSEPQPEEKARQQAQQALLNQRLTALQDQAGKLVQQVTDQEQRMLDLASTAQALNAQILQLRRELKAGPSTVAAKPGQPAAQRIAQAKPPKPAAERAAGEKPAPAGRFWMRLILVLIILGAGFAIFKIFMGRWGEDEGEEDDEEITAESLDEEITTEEGTIRIAPEAQSPPFPAPSQEPKGPEDPQTP